MYNQTDLKEILGELTSYEKKNAPDHIFYEGNLKLLSEGRRVAVVGSRKVSDHGIRRTRILCKTLAEQSITIVSGLAEGVDTIAHKTAIEHSGDTIAVLGTPINKVYPKGNSQLLEIIKKKHLAISQFPEGYPFQKKNFPIRNRTMALISDATIIVEASESSGTRHQGWEALRLGRSVFIMENVFNNPSVKWAREMLQYGASILTRDTLEEFLIDLPYLTSRKEVAF